MSPEGNKRWKDFNSRSDVVAITRADPLLQEIAENLRRCEVQIKSMSGYSHEVRIYESVAANALSEVFHSEEIEDTTVHTPIFI